MLPFFEEHDIKLLRMLIDRGTKSPQTNGICERFHKTALNEFYRVAFRKKVIVQPTSCRPINEARPHQGRWCFGKTPMQTFLDAMTREKMIAA